MHRFFVDENGFRDGVACLEESDARHACRVLRLAPGDQVELMDGARRFRAEILPGAGDAVRCRLVEELPSTEAALRITLFQGLPKAEKMEFIVQKLTELGAVAVVPVTMERCVARMTERDGEKKRERWQKIVREAAKQSGRTVLPTVETPARFEAMLERFKDFDAVLTPWEEARGYGPLQFSREHPQARNLALVVGPEGGITAAEVMRMEAAGARPLTLGRRILRTETAGMAASAALLALYGDMDGT